MEKNIRCIAYVMPAFPVASETFITTEIKAMQWRDYSILPICLEATNETCQPGDEGILMQMECVKKVSLIQVLTLFFTVIFYFFTSGWKAVIFAFEQQGIRPRSLILQGLKLAYLARKGGAQHIHAHFAWASSSTAIIAARFIGIGVSFTAHGSDVYKTPSDLHLKLQYADYSIAVCNRMKKDFHALCESAKVFVVPCGVDTYFFTPEERNEKQVSPNSSAVSELLYVGRLSETKGVDHLISALAIIPADLRPTLDIAGDGPMKAECEGLVEKLGLGDWVNFKGSVDRVWIQKKAHYYKAMVLPFCRSKTGAMDTGPLVIKEAMAMKVPIVTTDIMVNGELIDDQCATITPSSNPKRLAGALLNVCGRGGKKSLGSDRSIHLLAKAERAYKRVHKHFSSEAQALSLARLLNRNDQVEINSGSKKA